MMVRGGRTEYRGPDLSAALGDRLQLALGLDERPEAFGDWIDAVAALADRADVELDLDALCTTDDSPHRATFDGRTQHYRCAFDPFVVPFLADGVDEVEIETTAPDTGAPVSLTVATDGVDVEPSDAVISFGVAADVEGPPADGASPLLAYERFCPYGHAFPDRDEYEAWAADVDAVTTAIAVPDALELARALGAAAD